jgi:hypothetical protein
MRLAGVRAGSHAGQSQRIRLDCVSEANHNLNRLLDKPGGSRKAHFNYKKISFRILLVADDDSITAFRMNHLKVLLWQRL